MKTEPTPKEIMYRFRVFDYFPFGHPSNGDGTLVYMGSVRQALALTSLGEDEIEKVMQTLLMTPDRYFKGTPRDEEGMTPEERIMFNRLYPKYKPITEFWEDKPEEKVKNIPKVGDRVYRVYSDYAISKEDVRDKYYVTDWYYMFLGFEGNDIRVGDTLYHKERLYINKIILPEDYDPENPEESIKKYAIVSRGGEPVKAFEKYVCEEGTLYLDKDHPKYKYSIKQRD